MRTGIHARSLNSPQLKSILSLLLTGKEFSTLDLHNVSGSLAVSTCIAELRTHLAPEGWHISHFTDNINGKAVHFYRMVAA